MPGFPQKLQFVIQHRLDSMILLDRKMRCKRGALCIDSRSFASGGRVRRATLPVKSALLVAYENLPWLGMPAKRCTIKDPCF
ncbi:hypothetical protein TNCV_4812641 [Trichonephila clavipes]|nr:hypothetical protein TNCV_4812641 [Trichonephila clavipes]